MVASGLPTPNPLHAKNLALFALAFRTVVEDFNETLRSYEIAANLFVKVGLATGKAVAGVIGRRQFTYDVFGDTVNVASRMYSNAPKDKIMLSPEMRNALKRNTLFKITPHPSGMIPIKGKGMMATYILVSQREVHSLSTDAIFSPISTNDSARGEVHEFANLASPEGPSVTAIDLSVADGEDSGASGYNTPASAKTAEWGSSRR